MRPEKIQACKLFWQRLLHDIYSLVTLLTPVSDWDRISPYNINTISSRQVTRIKKTINLKIISWSNTKFPELTL